MRVARRPSRPLRLVLATIAGLALALPALAALDAPADRAAYQPTEQGFTHFVQDTLGPLAAGQQWSWAGHDYEAVRLHRITRTEVDRLEAPASRDHGTGLRGWTVCVLHVKVDGHLKRARIAANAAYTSDGSGWRWTEALLYVGVGDSYDFVSASMR